MTRALLMLFALQASPDGWLEQRIDGSMIIHQRGGDAIDNPEPGRGPIDITVRHTDGRKIRLTSDELFELIEWARAHRRAKP